MWKNYVGGVLAFGKSAFIKVNGFTNIMFGWGREDDEMYFRSVNLILFLNLNFN